MRSERRLAIEAALQRRYPCQSVPLGVFTEIGREFGVSRERVRQIAAGLGMESPLARAARRNGEKAPPQCANCGAQRATGKGRRYCEDCAYPLVACVQCGTLTRQHRSVLTMTEQGRGRYCSHACRDRALGEKASARFGHAPGEIRERVLALRAQGLNQAAIAKACGVSGSTVYWHLARAGAEK